MHNQRKYEAYALQKDKKRPYSARLILVGTLLLDQLYKIALKPLYTARTRLAHESVSYQAAHARAKRP